MQACSIGPQSARDGVGDHVNYPLIFHWLCHNFMSLPWKEDAFITRRLPQGHSWGRWCLALRQVMRVRNVHLWMRYMDVRLNQEL